MTILLDSDIPKDEIRGQYLMDHREDPDDPRLNVDPTGTKAARGDGYAGMHHDNMFDQGSALPDEATGLTNGARINKDPFYDFEINGLSIVDGIAGAATAEIAKRHSDKTQDAEAWLQTHDPQYKKNKSNWGE